MDSSNPASKKGKAKAEAEGARASKKSKVEVETRKPRILLGACGTVDAVNFAHVCRGFQEWAEIRVVLTKSSLRFVIEETLPRNVTVYRDESEWIAWRLKERCGGELTIELGEWADIMVIAPLSANTLAKIAGALCDDLLTSIVRGWNYSKPIFVAPSMNDFIWRSPTTEQQFINIETLGITFIPPLPLTHTSASGDLERKMAEPITIYSTVRASYDELKMKQKNIQIALSSQQPHLVPMVSQFRLSSIILASLKRAKEIVNLQRYIALKVIDSSDPASQKGKAIAEAQCATSSSKRGKPKVVGRLVRRRKLLFSMAYSDSCSQPYLMRWNFAVVVLGIKLIPTVAHVSATGVLQYVAMAELSTINSTVKRHYDQEMNVMVGELFYVWCGYVGSRISIRETCIKTVTSQIGYKAPKLVEVSFNRVDNVPEAISDGNNKVNTLLLDGIEELHKKMKALEDKESSWEKRYVTVEDNEVALKVEMLKLQKDIENISLEKDYHISTKKNMMMLEEIPNSEEVVIDNPRTPPANKDTEVHVEV
ncbi:hypothetical protein VNO78_15409 [Psophocarpus tetragonolobus]|uniref:phosphopantothenoylcysteine decarboxylase n=1 Tax=Psophocarpus tetragonolobus TaxID=3891 RepID=A0AAN9SIQ5_PSOTE